MRPTEPAHSSKLRSKKIDAPFDYGIGITPLAKLPPPFCSFIKEIFVANACSEQPCIVRLWLSRRGLQAPRGQRKRGRPRAAFQVGLGKPSLGKIEPSEVDASTSVEEVEVVERRSDVLEVAIPRYRGVAGHEVDLGGQVLVHRIEVHVG